MAAYQADALQVLSLGALGERVEGEVTLVGEHAWQQLKVLQALQPEPEAGRASSSAQSSAELASSASADSRYPAAQHDRHSMFWLSDTIWFSYVNEAPAWMMK